MVHSSGRARERDAATRLGVELPGDPDLSCVPDAVDVADPGFVLPGAPDVPEGPVEDVPDVPWSLPPCEPDAPEALVLLDEPEPPEPATGDVAAPADVFAVGVDDTVGGGAALKEPVM